MRLALYIAIVLAGGLFLGGLSAQFAIERTYGIGAIKTGTWRAWPFVGGLEIDPYTAARSTIEGQIPLGAGEGLTFEAADDSDGRRLQRNCSYRLMGNTPATQVWTLTAYSLDGRLIRNEDGRASAMLSSNVVRNPDFSLQISIGDFPSSGNWMRLAGNGEFKLVLRLYDTPTTSSAGLSEPSMPKIERLECG